MLAYLVVCGVIGHSFPTERWISRISHISPALLLPMEIRTVQRPAVFLYPVAFFLPSTSWLRSRTPRTTTIAILIKHPEAQAFVAHVSSIIHGLYTSFNEPAGFLNGQYINVYLVVAAKGVGPFGRGPPYVERIVSASKSVP